MTRTLIFLFLHMQFKDEFSIFNKQQADLDWTVVLNKTILAELCDSVCVCLCVLE